jgi:hypothetical protein
MFGKIKKKTLYQKFEQKLTLNLINQRIIYTHINFYSFSCCYMLRAIKVCDFKVLT